MQQIALTLFFFKLECIIFICNMIYLLIKKALGTKELTYIDYILKNWWRYLYYGRMIEK